MEQGIIIGIDLGTTNSLVSYYDNGQCKIIPNILGSHLTPSVVSVPGYFNDFQRRATMEAGKLTGLKVGRLISEPTTGFR